MYKDKKVKTQKTMPNGKKSKCVACLYGKKCNCNKK